MKKYSAAVLILCFFTLGCENDRLSNVSAESQYYDEVLQQFFSPNVNTRINTDWLPYLKTVMSDFEKMCDASCMESHGVFWKVEQDGILSVSIVVPAASGEVRTEPRYVTYKLDIESGGLVDKIVVGYQE